MSSGVADMLPLLLSWSMTVLVEPLVCSGGFTALSARICHCWWYRIGENYLKVIKRNNFSCWDCVLQLAVVRCHPADWPPLTVVNPSPIAFYFNLPSSSVSRINEIPIFPIGTFSAWLERKIAWERGTTCPASQSILCQHREESCLPSWAETTAMSIPSSHLWSVW